MRGKPATGSGAICNKPDIDILTGKYEIVSLTGTLAQSGSHLHIAISDSTGKTIGGHLKEGSIVYTIAEIVIAILPGVVYERETDNTYDYKEIVIQKADG
jgi:predicted DNA-binding protein with PD1-like motif